VPVRRPRLWIFAAIVVVLTLGFAASLAVGTARRSLPDLEGRITLEGLSAPVEVVRDEYGVPQIYADHAEDLFQAQGFVHAQDRFYQMDVRRHLAAGRLSELFGVSQVTTDAYVRTLGWRRIAEREVSLLSPSTRRYLDAYAAGVNSYLRGRSAADVSLEYSLLNLQGLDYTPEDWTAVDSVAWLKVMAWELSSNRSQESELAVMTARVGAARAAQLFPPHPFRDFAPIVRHGRLVDGAFDPAAVSSPARSAPAGGVGEDTLRRASGALSSVAELDRVLSGSGIAGPSGSGAGSNSYAASGRRTTTGSALLANDPHLATAIPSMFTQAGLHCRVRTTACPFGVTGFSLSGVPGVLIGKNPTIAWGVTTSYADTVDLYLEQVQGDMVRRGEGYQPLQVRTEQIAVRGEDAPRSIRVRTSRHGPLLSDVDPQLETVGTATAANGEPYGVAVAWTGYRPGRVMDAVFALNRARSFPEFRAAAGLLTALTQNVLYADTAGNIGSQLAGSVPRRGRGDGRTPAPGWDAAFDWRGVLPFAALPHAYNPPHGVLVAANQPTIGAPYPYRLGSQYSYGWRSEQITRRLEEARPLSPATAEQILYDDSVLFAADLVPVLLRITVNDPWVLEGQRTLVGWDYRASADSAAAAYFHVVVHNLLKRTFRDEMPEALWPAGGGRWYAVLSTLLAQPRDAWWDDVATPAVRETRDDILLASLTGARKELTSLLARDTNQWQWGKLHRVTLRHQTLGTGGVGAVERMFNRGDYPVSGGPATVNALGFDTRTGYRVQTGPAMRMVVDLGNPDASRWVNQSGVSGHAFDTHYEDQTALWATNRTWPFRSSRAAVDQAAVSRLELVPSG